MKPSESPNQPSNNFDISLEKGHECATLEQLRAFKPEAFDVKQLGERLIQQFKMLLSSARLPESYESTIEQFKMKIAQSVSSALSGAEIDFEINEKELSSLNAKSPLQMRAADVTLKDVEGLLQKISNPINTIKTVTELLNYISQLEAKIREISVLLNKSYENRERISEERTTAEEELAACQSGGVKNGTLKRINSKLDAIKNRQESASSKISKKESQLAQAKASLKQIESFLSRLLNGDIENCPDIREIESYIRDLDTPNNDFKNEIQTVLSTPQTIPYRSLSVDAQQQLEKEKRAERVRASIKTWGLRFALLSAVMGGGMAYKCHMDETRKAAESEEVKKKMATFVVNDDLPNGVIECLKGNSDVRDCKQLLEYFYQAHPFADKFLRRADDLFTVTASQKADKKGGKKTIEIPVKQEAVRTKVNTSKAGGATAETQFRIPGDKEKVPVTIIFQMKDKLMQAELDKLLTGTAGTACYSYKSETNRDELSLAIPQFLIDNLRKAVGYAEVQFHIVHKNGRYPSEENNILVVENGKVTINRHEFCKMDDIFLVAHVAMYVPGSPGKPYVYALKVKVPSSKEVPQFCK